MESACSYELYLPLKGDDQMAGDTTPDAFVPSAYFERIHGLPRSRSQPQKNLDIGVYDADFFIYRKFREFEADVSALMTLRVFNLLISYYIS